MNACNKTMTLFALLLPLALGHARAERVTITSSHARAATEQWASHQATCQDTRYELRVNRQARSVQFIVDQGSPIVHDIASTPLGATMLGKNVVGRFGFSCGGGLNVYFLGFALNKTSAPRPVEYIITIRNDGSMPDDAGLRDMTLSDINAQLN